MYCRMCIDVHGLTPTKLNEPNEAEYLVSHCYQGDLKWKKDENQGLIQHMCGECVKKLKKNTDIHLSQELGIDPILSQIASHISS